jgi:hypothetical protein
MKPQMYPRGKALRVFWVDSTQSGGWRYGENHSVVIENIATLGWITETDEDGLSMTSTLSRHGGVLTVVSIPWQAVVDIQELPEWDRDANLPELALL